MSGIRIRVTLEPRASTACPRCSALAPLTLRLPPAAANDHVGTLPEGRTGSCCGWCREPITRGRLATHDEVVAHQRLCPFQGLSKALSSAARKEVDAEATAPQEGPHDDAQG